MKTKQLPKTLLAKLLSEGWICQLKSGVARERPARKIEGEKMPDFI